MLRGKKQMILSASKGNQRKPKPALPLYCLAMLLDRQVQHSMSMNVLDIQGSTFNVVLSSFQSGESKPQAGIKAGYVLLPCAWDSGMLKSAVQSAKPSTFYPRQNTVFFARMGQISLQRRQRERKKHSFVLLVSRVIN